MASFGKSPISANSSRVQHFGLRTAEAFKCLIGGIMITQRGSVGHLGEKLCGHMPAGCNASVKFGYCTFGLWKNESS